MCLQCNLITFQYICLDPENSLSNKLDVRLQTDTTAGLVIIIIIIANIIILFPYLTWKPRLIQLLKQLMVAYN